MEQHQLTPVATLEVLEAWKKEGYTMIDMYIRPERINNVIIIDLKPVKSKRAAVDRWPIHDRIFVEIATKGSPNILFLVKGTLPKREAPDSLLIFGRSL